MPISVADLADRLIAGQKWTLVGLFALLAAWGSALAASRSPAELTALRDDLLRQLLVILPDGYRKLLGRGGRGN